MTNICLEIQESQQLLVGVRLIFHHSSHSFSSLGSGGSKALDARIEALNLLLGTVKPSVQSVQSVHELRRLVWNLPNNVMDFVEVVIARMGG